MSFFVGKLRIVKIHGNVITMSFSILKEERYTALVICWFIVYVFFTILMLSIMLLYLRIRRIRGRGGRGGGKNTFYCNCCIKQKHYSEMLNVVFFFRECYILYTSVLCYLFVFYIFLYNMFFCIYYNYILLHYYIKICWFHFVLHSCYQDSSLKSKLFGFVSYTDCNESHVLLIHTEKK